VHTGGFHIGRIDRNVAVAIAVTDGGEGRSG
jgi:hypothetical protein